MLDVHGSYLSAQGGERLDQDGGLNGWKTSVRDHRLGWNGAAGLMCRQPAMRAPFSGWSDAYFVRVAIRPGISFSASSISRRPKAANDYKTR